MKKVICLSTDKAMCCRLKKVSKDGRPANRIITESSIQVGVYDVMAY